MAFYIGVVHLAQVREAERQGYVSFAHGDRASVEKVVPGDKVVYYAPKEDEDGAPVQAFIAHATVTGEEVETRSFGSHGTGQVRRATYDAVREVPVRPMIEDLEILAGKQNWGGVFRSGKVEIGAADYQRIAGAMLGGA